MTPPSTDTDVVVVGAGVIGIAVARELAVRGRDVAVLESADEVGTATSAHNSEVIHSGIYYPTGSRKAVASVVGRDLLYRYCAERAIGHRRIGKLIVATSPGERDALDVIERRARRNGVDDVRRLTAPDVRALEPDLQADAALFAPSTGIVDSAALVRSLLADAVADGATLVLRSPVVGVDIERDGVFRVHTASEALRCRAVVNCAGLGAWAVAESTVGLGRHHIPPRFRAKGNYFAMVGGRPPFTHLIYPVPVDGGLGVHLTLDLAGGTRFGPDVQWLDPEVGDDYGVDPSRADRFYAEIRRYWPALPDDSLVPAMAGIRPKCSGPGEPPADFVVSDRATHGIDGLVNLFGIESPGLTSSLALAREVAGLVGPV